MGKILMLAYIMASVSEFILYIVSIIFRLPEDGRFIFRKIDIVLLILFPVNLIVLLGMYIAIAINNFIDIIMSETKGNKIMEWLKKPIIHKGNKEK